MGKTAVFVLSTLHQLTPVTGEVHVVVLCHTRELAFQIQREYERFCKYLPDVKSRVFYGGVNVKGDLEALKAEVPHIVVGTPGRIMDLATVRKALDLSKVRRIASRFPFFLVFFVPLCCAAAHDSLSLSLSLSLSFSLHQPTTHNSQLT